MKKTTLLAGAGALAASIGLSYGQAAFTKPVGYHTETVSPGFNVLAPNLVDAPLASGALTAAAGTTLTDADVDFTGLLEADTDYSIEFDNGTHSRIAEFTANTVTTVDSLALEANAGDNNYIIRKVRTLGDYFGADNSAGFQVGGADSADIIWIPDGEGFFKAYFAEAVPVIGTTAGWKLISTGDDDQTDFPIDFTSGLIVQRRADTALDLTFTGHVKLTPTLVDADAPFTYISQVYPTGSTLGNSGLQSGAVTGAANTATNIWIGDGGGGFLKGYFADAVPVFGFTAGWKLVSTDNDDASGQALTSAVIVQRNQEAYTLNLTPPPFYADL
jgi:hypothetical protein